MAASIKLVKLALKRDISVPIGQPAPLHLDCPCGVEVPVISDYQTCIGCGNTYDEAGYLHGAMPGLEDL